MQKFAYEPPHLSEEEEGEEEEKEKEDEEGERRKEYKRTNWTFRIKFAPKPLFLLPLLSCTIHDGGELSLALFPANQEQT